MSAVSSYATTIVEIDIAKIDVKTEQVHMESISCQLDQGEGFRDIGHYFSDKSPENLNLDSKKIIKKTMSLVLKKQLKLNNVDVTIVAQKPNLSSYISEMELSLSSILDISTDRISLKATTTEGMGEIGEENGLAVYALATLKN